MTKKQKRAKQVSEDRRERRWRITSAIIDCLGKQDPTTTRDIADCVEEKTGAGELATCDVLRALRKHELIFWDAKNRVWTATRPAGAT